MMHIIMMTILGMISGMISLFWTRIIRKNMIFSEIGKYLEKVNNAHLIDYRRDFLPVKFARCAYCLCPWIVFALELFYIIDEHPSFIYDLIGIAGGLGAGNLVVEFTYALRTEE